MAGISDILTVCSFFRDVAVPIVYRNVSLYHDKNKAKAFFFEPPAEYYAHIRTLSIAGSRGHDGKSYSSAEVREWSLDLRKRLDNHAIAKGKESDESDSKVTSGEGILLRVLWPLGAGMTCGAA
jgi:hypothetical protein